LHIPIKKQLLTFNQWVTGSNPVRLTTEINDLAVF
jgi:hypothetical protein